VRRVNAEAPFGRAANRRKHALNNMWSGGLRSAPSGDSSGGVTFYHRRASQAGKARQRAWTADLQALVGAVHAALPATLGRVLVEYLAAVVSGPVLSAATLRPGVLPVQQVHGTSNTRVAAHRDVADLHGSFIVWFVFSWAEATAAAAAAAAATAAGAAEAAAAAAPEAAIPTAAVAAAAPAAAARAPLHPPAWFVLWSLGVALPVAHTSHMFVRSPDVYHGTLFPAGARSGSGAGADGGAPALLSGMALVNKAHVVTRVLGHVARGESPWDARAGEWAPDF
jgi:hypothetical protein